MLFPYGTVLVIQRKDSRGQIRQRLQQIRDLGMDHVVIWPAVYWWEEKCGKNYPFQTGIHILEDAGEIGLKVIMEFSGQHPSLEFIPDFLMKESYYATYADGTPDKRYPFVFGYLNYNHPEVRSLLVKGFSEAARHYRAYPALYGYDVWNETMFSSYDPYTLDRFRKWLEARYQTIDKLNAVWERTFHDWSQVDFSRWMWASVMPLVDYYQFKKANIGMLVRDWTAAIAAVDPDHPVIADNIASMISMDSFHDRPQEDWDLARSADEIGISLYPKTQKEGMPAWRRWQTLAAIHSASPSGRFWISELQSHHQAMFNPFSAVYPHDLRWWNWEAIASGAAGLIYWKWDPFNKGIQTYGRGLVDTGGQYTVRAREAARIKQLLDQYASAFCSSRPVQPQAAILYDPLCHDFSKAFTVNYGYAVDDSIYLDSLAGLYACLWQLNVPVDFIRPEDLAEGGAGHYKVVFISSQINIDKNLTSALRAYVEDGGTVISDGKFGLIDNESQLYQEIPAGPLSLELGYVLDDIDPHDLEIRLDNEVFHGLATESLTGCHERQVLRRISSTCEEAGRFADGSPAILSSHLGKGRFWHIGTLLWYHYHQSQDPRILELAGWLRDQYDLAPVRLAADSLKVRLASCRDGLILYIFNYSHLDEAGTLSLPLDAEACTVTDLYAEKTWQEKISQEKLHLSVQVKAQDVCLLLIRPS